MRLFKGLLLAFIGACTCLPVIAQDNVTFGNTDGTFTGTSMNSGDLGLGGSTLTGISGFTPTYSPSMVGYDTFGPNLGSLNFSTGALSSTALCPTLLTCTPVAMTMVPLTNEISQFAGGGMFNVTDTFNGGFGGFVFSGTFTPGATWSCAAGSICKSTGANTWKGTWSFTGTLTGVTLVVDGQVLNVGSGPITIQSTTEKNVVVTMNNGNITFTDAGGSTTFNGKFSLSPEPGSLALFGSGLVVVGILARRRLAGKPAATSN